MNNDLISREDLKKALEVTQYNDIDDLTRTERLINNASPIEDTPVQRFWEQAYERGKADRPQGEWIIDGHHYKCSRCGKTLAIMFSETDDDDLIGCPFCLADMRVKGERPQTIGCFNCKYDYKRMTEEPCKYCNEKFSEWQAEGGRE